MKVCNKYTHKNGGNNLKRLLSASGSNGTHLAKVGLY